MTHDPVRQSTRSPLRVGIVGLGRSGWTIHVQGLLAMADRYRIVAVADPVETRRDEAHALIGCTTTEAAAAVINDPRVDIVIVASPSHTHVSLGLEALTAGKHVVLEKPMAHTVEEIDELTNAATAADRIVTCFHNNRFEASLQSIRRLLDAGRIGEPLLIRRTVHRYSRRRDWQTLRQFGGGELSNQVSHYLDQLLTLIGDTPVKLLASDLRHTISAGDAEDHAKIVLRANDGPLIEIEGSTSIALPQPAWFIAGTAGAITGSPGDLTVRWLDPTQLPNITADTGPAVDRRYGPAEELPWQQETIRMTPVDRTLAFFDNLSKAIAGQAALAITPLSVRRQIALLDQAREQALTGQS